ncbi:TIGR02234 family membrane protein [Corynebacterium pseudopelargi]|uniref:Tryptophan-associated transmembrane protein n=1 Tax=Corynebacterium pseudopelargi TaxID=2080757 RepID=A0A3G6IXW2_9CORY|nr:TIGR02234 family membrane protein [Corynebacterium pseudopelargi]AZA08970.1 Tryptophan-associated transmembrane protein [Corynebacterium pseudopelargi]
MKKTAALLLAIAAGMLGGAASMTWFDVTAQDDKSGVIETSVSGATWSKEVTAIALALAAACIAGLALRRTGRRIIGIAAAALSALGALPFIGVLSSEADPERMHKLLSERDDQGVAVLTNWAQINQIDLHPTGPILGLVACAIGVFAGVLLAVRPGQEQRDKYERTQMREEELAQDPDSERALWDAIDADIDPTDREAKPK